MATNRRRTSVSTDAIWNVLADPHRYADWVVGARLVRGVEGAWPEVGASLHHQFGVGPLHVSDRTLVRQVTPGRELLLEARGSTLGRALVHLVLAPDADGTLITMTERLSMIGVGRLADLLLVGPTWARNAWSLQRLVDLASGH